ncbi:hypothetical protein [Streptomyces sp. NPDC089795]|uniref:hypothetical protein n=1 Tax=Streptomyces sp. NPDC089795 TaxID=3155297 RepID=UPI00343B673A
MTSSPPAPPAFAHRTPRGKAARVLFDVPAPAHLLAALLLLVGRHGTTSWAGLGWSLLAALFCGVVPIGIILVVLGAPALLAAPVAAAAGRSRPALEAHTPAQLLAAPPWAARRPSPSRS